MAHHEEVVDLMAENARLTAERDGLLRANEVQHGISHRKEGQIDRMNIKMAGLQDTIKVLTDRAEQAEAERDRLRDDRWKHGAESMRHAILQQLPGGQLCDPQQIADMIRAIGLPSDEQ